MIRETKPTDGVSILKYFLLLIIPLSSLANALDFQFSFDGPISGQHCTLLVEPDDPNTWDDNYLCSKEYMKMKWSYSSENLSDWHCAWVYEPSDPAKWDDNYICSEYFIGLEFSGANPIPGKTCVALNEPSDPHTWDDNFLCWNHEKFKAAALEYKSGQGDAGIDIQALTDLQALTHSPFQERRVEECGVEVYKAERSDKCGEPEKYVAMASDNCNEIYPTKKGKVCGEILVKSESLLAEKAFFNYGNSQEQEDYCLVSGKGELNESCDSYCQSQGHLGAEGIDFVFGSEGSATGVSYKIEKWERAGYCRSYDTCASKTFGDPIGWEVCEHPNHPVALYSECRLEEFGPEIFNACSIKMTRNELELYLASVRAALPANARLYAISEIGFVRDAANRSQMACFVKKYDKPRYKFVYNDLVDLFVSKYGISPDSIAQNCDDDSQSSVQTLTVNGNDCDAYGYEEMESLASSGQVGAYSCLSKKNFSMVDGWVAFQIAEVNQLLGDVVASQDFEVYDQLESLRSELEEVQNP